MSGIKNELTKNRILFYVVIFYLSCFIIYSFAEVKNGIEYWINSFLMSILITTIVMVFYFMSKTKKYTYGGQCFYYRSSIKYKKERKIVLIFIICAIISLSITTLNEALKFEWPPTSWPYYYDDTTVNMIKRVVGLVNIMAIPVATISISYIIGSIFFYKSKISEIDKNEAIYINTIRDIIQIVYDLSFVLVVASKINCELAAAINTDKDDCVTSKCLMPDYYKNTPELKCHILKQFESHYEEALDRIIFSLDNIKNISAQYFYPLSVYYESVIFIKRDDLLSKVYLCRNLIRIFRILYIYYNNDRKFVSDIINFLNFYPEDNKTLLHRFIEQPIVNHPSFEVTKNEIINNIYSICEIDLKAHS